MEIHIGTMTRITRSSARLARAPQQKDVPEKEHCSESRLRGRAKPIIDSDDSEEDCIEATKAKTVLSTPKKQKSHISNSELHQISPVTPPKQKKNYNDSVATPKHRTTNSGGAQSPSVLMGNLILTSPPPKLPATPSQRNIKVQAGSEAENKTVRGIQNRKSLFSNDSSGKSENKKPETDRLHENGESNENQSEAKFNVYQTAKRALHSTFPANMPGREGELDELRTGRDVGIVVHQWTSRNGKTASLNIILEDENISAKLCKVYVNCTSIKSPTAVYSRIAKELGIKVNGKTEKEFVTVLERYFKKSDKMTLLVLDEIDQLENKNQSILYTVFEWPSKPHSRLVLIGIANALDLTDRTLPRLQASCELKPQLMHFAPYTKQQIVQIFTARLKSSGVLDVFSPPALQMLAAKVAAVSGDVRRALDIGRRVVEMIERDRSNEVLKSIDSMVNALDTQESKPKVDLRHVVSVLNNVYGTSQSLVEESDDSFPLQQKIVVCSLLLMLKKARNKDVTVGRLHEVYRRACAKRNLQAVDQAEFVGLCSLIETRGILRVTGRKEPRLHKVSLEWDVGEVENALRDKQLVSAIMQDDGCLGKL
ncbi:hypothetical protein NQ318_019593 [Aromia moschata]|uniref:Cell division control protein n=1 Tax=Aromia moschata TaxID=1265417 RepID=A0AAV8Z5N5_9CUCU|nr:hypothetical protein NQ318_019593 [Aromia moschata]